MRSENFKEEARTMEKTILVSRLNDKVFIYPDNYGEVIAIMKGK